MCVRCCIKRARTPVYLCAYETGVLLLLVQVYVPTVFENYVADIQVAGVDYELALWDTAGPCLLGVFGGAKALNTMSKGFGSVGCVSVSGAWGMLVVLAVLAMLVLVVLMVSRVNGPAT